SVLIVPRTSNRNTPEGLAWDQSPIGASSVPLIRGPFTQPPGRTLFTSSEESIAWVESNGAYSVIRNSVETLVVWACKVAGRRSAKATPRQRRRSENLRIFMSDFPDARRPTL